VPLNKIENIGKLVKPISEYLTYSKPVGIDVHIFGGQIYDINHREIINKTLLFSLEKVLELSNQTQGLFIGTLCSLTDPTKIIKFSPLLYDDINSLPLSPQLMVYDIIFPYFKADNPFRIRYDIVKKTAGKLPSCSCLDLHKFETIPELKTYIKDKFNFKRFNSFLIFDKEGRYHTSTRQLTYNSHEQVSFELTANQKYRSHIHKIIPIDIELEEGKIITIADSIETRFKNKKITVPITTPNYILRRNLWENRKELKRMPFIFEGLYFEEDNDFEILGTHYSKFIL